MKIVFFFFVACYVQCFEIVYVVSWHAEVYEVTRVQKYSKVFINFFDTAVQIFVRKIVIMWRAGVVERQRGSHLPVVEHKFISEKASNYQLLFIYTFVCVCIFFFVVVVFWLFQLGYKNSIFI